LTKYIVDDTVNTITMYQRLVMEEKSEEFTRILKTLTPEHQHTLRDYCRLAQAAEASARKSPAEKICNCAPV
jgi:hypothetical protein